VKKLLAMVPGLLALFALVSAPARADVIERVVAVVNDEPIFLSDVRRRATPFLPQVMEQESEMARVAALDELYRQLLDHMIDEELFRQAARRMEVSVTTEEVERAIRNVRQRANLSEEEFWEAVRGQGFTEAQYRSDLRRQLTRGKVLNQRVRGRVNITEEDVRRRYEQQVRQSGETQARFTFSFILFPFPAGADEAAIEAVRQQAAGVQARIASGELSFEDALAQNDGRGSTVREARAGDVGEQVAGVLEGLEPNQVGAPIESAAGTGIMLVRLDERHAPDADGYEDVREEIYAEMLDEAMARQERIFLVELRRDAVISRRLASRNERR
jgi:peptidyl-prolyl cis-trans isomerase SurA